MTTYCGWAIPGYRIFVCIEDAHGPEQAHKPHWLTNEQLRAMAAMRRHGRTSFPLAEEASA